MDNALERLRQTVETRRETDDSARAERYESLSKERLKQILDKKLRTAFIGALAQFEEHFGCLWGHGKDRNECSEAEFSCRDLWSRCRTEVLNNGNNQIRAVAAELELYTVVFNRYQLNLFTREDGDGREQKDVQN